MVDPYLPNGSTNYLRFAKVAGTGAATTFTLLPASAASGQPACAKGPYSTGWTDDSAYLVTMGNGISCPGINIYRNNRDDTFTWMGTVPPAVGDPAFGHAIGSFSNGY
jgi:hypothetical protein